VELVTLSGGLMRAPMERKVAVGVLLLSLGAVGFLPLFAGPSYEFGLATGVVGPALAAACTACEVVRRQLLPRAAFELGARLGATLAVLALCVALGHGLRVGMCDPLHEFLWFALGPLVGLLFAGVFGAVVGVLA